MTVQFLQDHGQYDDGEPLYQQGEIACIIYDVAQQWIKEGIVRASQGI